ncbi:MAG: ankyrin repeat domain-containing protein, partial [Acidobacteriota bacterium]|nr:ankyrin repeat domain-containing protein [Acidobacteriota bacterium]
LLAKGADVNAKSKMGRSPLLMAASDDRGGPVVKLLLAKGAQVDARDSMQTTALFQAANREIAQMLIAKGASVNAKNVVGLTPLMQAASLGDPEWVRLLLAKGADVNAVTAPSFQMMKNGPIGLGLLTPLLLAVAYGPPELVKLLIDAGADVNAKDVRGMTPLMLAIGCDHNDPRVVKLLLASGADPKIKSKSQEDALAWANKVGSADVLAAFGSKAVLDHGAKPPVITADFATPDVSKAVAKSIGLLQKSTSKFLVEGGCASCHAHNLTAIAVSLARSKGTPVDEAAAAEQLKATRFGWSTFEQPMLQRMDPPGGADMTAYGLLGLGAEKEPAQSVTDAMVFNLAAEQGTNGSWHIGGIARPPMEDGDITRTAIAIRSLRLYGMPSRKHELDERIALAKAWLSAAEPRTTEDRNMQLLGLQWAGTDAASLSRMTRELIALQRRDGGWAQTRDLTSDAYATGQTLYALSSSGLPATDAAYRRGLAYLLKTQLDDGSWHVASRAPKFQPYFQSGFPHDHDQWISSAATAWASMALSASLPDARGLAILKP